MEDSPKYTTRRSKGGAYASKKDKLVGAKKSQKKEEGVQKTLSKMVKYKYPWAVFVSEQSGLFVGFAAAEMLKTTRSNHLKHLDWQLQEPRGQFHGLYLELKSDRSKLYLKDGVTYRADNRTVFKGKGNTKVAVGKEDRIQEQRKSIWNRRDRGFAAFFACGVDEAIAIVDWYMGLGEFTGKGDKLPRGLILDSRSIPK